MNTAQIADHVLKVIRAAGGKVVGRTRLQKLIYLLEAGGLGVDVPFYYKHYGPYSEELVSAVQVATLLGDLLEEEQTSSWGGHYSIYSCQNTARTAVSEAAQRLIDLATRADPVELELAATALYLNSKGYSDAWDETRRRKPDKALPPKLANAQVLYSRFRQIRVPRPFPELR